MPIPMRFTALLCANFVLVGCDVKIRPSESVAPSPEPSSTQSDTRADNEALNRQLLDLQVKLADIDRSLSADIARIREQLATKIDRADAKKVVGEEFTTLRIRERVDALKTRAEGLEERLDKLEEHFGFFPRNAEPPWVKVMPEHSKKH